MAFREGRVSELPVKQRTLKVKERHLSYIYIRCNGFTAIHRRPAGDIWQGLYEPLCIEMQGEGLPLTSYLSPLTSHLSPLTSHLSPLASHLSPLKKNVKHVLTHRILYADFWPWETGERPALPEDYFWIKEEEMDNYGVPRLIEILLEKLDPPPAPPCDGGE